MDAGLTNEADVCADNWADHGDDREEERGEPENTHSSAGTGETLEHLEKQKVALLSTNE